MKPAAKTILEKAHRVPVYWEGDVAVVGAGISGSIAAIAAGRQGAKTILVDRFTNLGGNIGPSMVCGGSIFEEAPRTLPGGNSGIAKEFEKRVKSVNSSTSHLDSSYTASFVLEEMRREAKVELLAPAYASNPVMDGKKTRGVFVETCSGRVAVLAKVVVDATGEASIAARAGAPIIRRMAVDPSATKKMIRLGMGDPKYAYWNDTHLRFFVAGVDIEKYETFKQNEVTLSDEDARWQKTFNWPSGLVPAARRAFEETGFRMHGDIQEHPRVDTYISDFGSCGKGIITAWIGARGEIDCDDAAQMTRIETFLRHQAYQWFSFMRKNAPGFEQSSLAAMSNFIGMRGGPCIVGEYMLTVQDYQNGTKFDDVLCRNIHASHVDYHDGEKTGFDVPYRCLLPKEADGLLVTGRGASFYRRGHDPSAMRARANMMAMGQAAGTAAALAVKQGITPRKLNVRELQKELLKAGFNLGPPERLRELGLG